MRDDGAHVRSMLEAAGLNPGKAEVAVLVDRYRSMRKTAAVLWSVDPGDGGSALVFRAAATGTEEPTA